MPLARLKRKIRVIRARGDAVECPCCGGRWKAMEPHRGRPDARCPQCGSLERHRVLWLFLHNETSLLAEDSSVLHIAPEPIFTGLLRDRPNITYLSGDMGSPYAMETMDITDIPRPEQSFDVVLCNHVLEHVPDDSKAMSEIRRVLKPGGQAYMQHPIDYSLAQTYEDPSVTTPQDRLREFGQEDHVRWYGADFIDRLRGAGLEVTMREYATELTQEQQRRYAIQDGQDQKRGADVYVCVRNGQAG